jgi:alpha-tubulin suppressor-like RCC1 family protein
MVLRLSAYALRLMAVGVVAGVSLAAGASGGSGRAVPTVAASAVSVGDLQTCALTTRARARCWGSNDYGQLRDGTTIDRSRPVVPSRLGRVRTIAAGARHICVITRAGAVKCWGGGMVTHPFTVVGIPGLGSGVTTIAMGVDAGCAVRRSGGVTCWDGALKPVDIDGLDGGATAIDTGTFHRCALTRAGAVRCWGSNRDGQLGDGTAVDHSDTAVAVSGLDRDVIAIAAGSHHTCALTRTGGVWCWGMNADGQLGDGTTASRATPVNVSGLRRVTAIAAGWAHTCALTQAGAVSCWGRNDHGQLGDTTTRTHLRPAPVSALGRGVRAVAAGGEQSCALMRGGGLRCWGWNQFGQLGDGTTRNRLRPVAVVGFGAAVRRSRMTRD